VCAWVERVLEMVANVRVRGYAMVGARSYQCDASCV